MRESVIYKLAQYSVLNDNSLSDPNKMEILRELISKEDVALFVEKRDAEEQKAVAQNETV